MPTLSGKQTGRLSEVLREAFVSVDALEEFLDVMLEKRLENIVSLRLNYQTVAFKLIKAADAEGWVPRLIAAACDARPGNAVLRELAAEVGLSGVPRGIDEALAGARLERTILEAIPFMDASTWHARLGELLTQVCRVEVPAGVRSAAGTGFLVDPDLVLTNYHVIEVLHQNMGNPRDTVLRFDYQRLPDGTTVNRGTEFRLASEWLVAWRPPSKVDDMIDPGDRLPAPDELDFALLRVNGAPGAQPIGRAEGLSQAPDRGWIPLDQAGQDGFDAGYPLFILQYPEDAPIKFMPGQSDGLNANGTRLRHQVNTKRGSSGSPCLNARLELVALHHAGDPNYDPSRRPAWNAAVPIAAIRGYLASP
jgi:Effector-associated domain 1/Trypsin-like peptidase domain